jgi:predicted RNA binding protein YcfA (HicA-like mRNA interferase family)
MEHTKCSTIDFPAPLTAKSGVTNIAQSRTNPRPYILHPTPFFQVEECSPQRNLKSEKHLILLQGTGGIILKVREIIKVIEADGWYLVTTKGSHRQFKHPEKTGRITIAGHLADDLAPGTMNSIFKQAHLKE